MPQPQYMQPPPPPPPSSPPSHHHLHQQPPTMPSSPLGPLGEPRDVEQRFATEASTDDAGKKKSKKVRFAAGAAEGTQSFYEKNKGLIIALVVFIFLILGVLVAVLIAKRAKGSTQASGELGGGAFADGAAFDPSAPVPGFHYGVLEGGGSHGAPVPQFVGGGAHSALPLRAWNESASVYVRR